MRVARGHRARTAGPALAALVGTIAGCTPASVRPIPPISIGVLGPGAASLPKVDGLALGAVALPAPRIPAVDGAQAQVARARAAYAQGEFDACREALARVEVVGVLARGEREVAARAITLEVACAFGAMAMEDARGGAARLAGFGLALPEGVVPPDVEGLIGAAQEAAGKAPRTALAVRGEAGARLLVDGRPAGCVLPCTVDVVDGDHVLGVEAEGFAPASRLVRTPAAAGIEVAQVAADPTLAATQWRARIGRGLPATDAVGARLLGQLGQARLVYLDSGDGALMVGGAVVARAHGADPAAVVRELAYDGGVLHRPSVWQRPWFWIAVSGAVAVIAGGVVALTYHPPKSTSLVF
jgi:hypothetical protein